jgi:hypothetical protein
MCVSMRELLQEKFKRIKPWGSIQCAFATTTTDIKGTANATNSKLRSKMIAHRP